MELGLDVHRVEVGEIRKQISTIQEKSNSQQSNERPHFEQLVLSAQEETFNEDKEQSKCNFRTDIDPRPDIQVIKMKRRKKNERKRKLMVKFFALILPDARRLQ